MGKSMATWSRGQWPSGTIGLVLLQPLCVSLSFKHMLFKTSARIFYPWLSTQFLPYLPFLLPLTLSETSGHTSMTTPPLTGCSCSSSH